MQSRSTLVALGLVALVGGGVIGGLLGSALFMRRAPAESPAAASPGGVPQGIDPTLARAIEELAREIKLLGGPQPAGTPTRREPAEGAPAEPGSQEALIAALERLTLALQASQGRASPGGIGITPLILPAGGRRAGALAALAGRDWEEISREHRFWTYQQVLDRFGHPDEVSGDGRWLYQKGPGNEKQFFTFVFQNGYLMNIYD